MNFRWGESTGGLKPGPPHATGKRRQQKKTETKRRGAACEYRRPKAGTPTCGKDEVAARRRARSEQTSKGVRGRPRTAADRTQPHPRPRSKATEQQRQKGQPATAASTTTKRQEKRKEEKEQRVKKGLTIPRFATKQSLLPSKMGMWYQCQSQIQRFLPE